MPTLCSIISCPNASRISKIADAKFFKCPKNEFVSSKWLNWIQLQNAPAKKTLKAYYLCHKHFSKSLFLTTGRLAPNAVPNINGRLDTSSQCVDSEISLSTSSNRNDKMLEDESLTLRDLLNCGEPALYYSSSTGSRASLEESKDNLPLSSTTHILIPVHRDAEEKILPSCSIDVENGNGNPSQCMPPEKNSEEASSSAAQSILPTSSNRNDKMLKDESLTLRDLLNSGEPALYYSSSTGSRASLEELKDNLPSSSTTHILIPVHRDAEENSLPSCSMDVENGNGNPSQCMPPEKISEEASSSAAQSMSIDSDLPKEGNILTDNTCEQTPKSKKVTNGRKKYVGDLSPSDFSTPRRASKYLTLVKDTVTKFRKKLKIEQVKRYRLLSRVKTLEALVKQLKEERGQEID